MTSISLLSSGCVWIGDKDLGSRLDQDNDGYINAQFGGDDCDDTNRAIYPGAVEIWYDDVNQSCKSGSDYDQDGDGLLSYHKDGLDCDDENAAVGSGSPGMSIVMAIATAPLPIR